MENLPPEQQTRLEALMAELETLPTPELIAESGRLRLPLPLNEVGKKRMRLAWSGAFSYGKVESYLDALRAVDHQRDRIGRQTFGRRQQARALKENGLPGFRELESQAIRLSGDQEVTFHFFAICVVQIARLLPMVAKAAGCKIGKADLDILLAFEPLRDYFEHLDQRLPGKPRHAEVVTESEGEKYWRLEMGFETDGQDRIVINGKAIDVTTRGVRAVERVVVDAQKKARESTLESVRKHFAATPVGIPSPEKVRKNPLVLVDAAWGDGVG